MAAISEILGELKQRKVVRVCGVYAVTAWGIFQICNNLFPALSMPKWTVTGVAILMLLGFPLAAIVAWAVEKGPDGVRLNPGVSPGARAQYHLTDWLLIAAMVGVVAITGAQIMGWTGRRVAADAAGASQAAEGAIAARSIAVLPFVSFAEGRESEDFADGLTEEVINSLAQMPELKVAGRTSAFYFKNRNTDLREIGKKLGVAHVMEGSVRRAGSRIRVTVQLISVKDGFHMWSQTYDRTLDDALALQTEIANTVAGVLKTKLLPTKAAPGRPGVSGEAYRLSLVGRARLRAGTQEDTVAARDLYKRLISIAPDQPAGYAGYAASLVLLAQDYSAIDFSPGAAEARQNIDHALQLAPNSADAWIAKAMLLTALMRRNTTLRYAGEAEQALRRALQAEPANPDALVYLANLRLKQDRPNDALGILQQVLKTDPLNRLALSLSADTLRLVGRRDEAIRQYRSLIELYPSFIDAKSHLAQTYVAQGRLDLAEPWLRAAAASGDITAKLLLAQLYLNLGMKPQAQQALATMGPGPAAAIGQVAWMMASGDYAKVVPFSRAKLEETHDPFWQDGINAGALMTGDAALGLQQHRQASPELFGPEPQVDSAGYAVPMDAAYFLIASGDRTQAERILKRVLQVAAPRSGKAQPQDDRIARAEAYALLGDRTRAVGELKAAFSAGYRTLYDLDHFVRLDQLPHTRSLQGDPEFKALIAAVDADAARMRARVQAAQPGASASPTTAAP